MPLQAVQGTGGDQTFDHPPVNRLQIDPFAKFEQVFKCPVCHPGLDDALSCPLAHILDRRHAEADSLFGRREVERALVDVGRQHRDLHLPALVEQHGEAVGVVAVGGQAGGHVNRGIVRLEKGVLVGHFCVAGRVGFVESVARKDLDVRPHLLGDPPVDAVFDRPIYEVLLVLLHQLGQLLAHRLANAVGLSQGKAG